MGGGASSLFDSALQLKLTHEQRKKYKEHYDELVKQGLPEEKIKVALQNKYNGEYGNAHIHQNHQPVTTSARIVKSERRPSLTGKPEVSTKSNSTRRRTFDTQQQLQQQQQQKTKNSDKANAGAAGATATAKSPPKMSTQDSLALLGVLIPPKVPWVSGDVDRPFGCELCRTAFKTSAQLDQHVKFSYLHAKAVAEHDSVSRVVDHATRLSTILHHCMSIIQGASSSTSSDSIDIAGKSKAWQRWHWAYKKIKMQNRIHHTATILLAHSQSTKRRNAVALTVKSSLFEGTKFFWKSQETMDLHMFLHEEAPPAPPAASAVTVSGGDVSAVPSSSSSSSSTSAAPAAPSSSSSAPSTGSIASAIVAVKAAHGAPTTTGAAAEEVIVNNPVLEVVIFDPKKHQELRRLYLNYARLQELLDAEIKAAVEERERVVTDKAKKTVVEYQGETVSGNNSGKSKRIKPPAAAAGAAAVGGTASTAAQLNSLLSSASVPTLTGGSALSRSASGPAGSLPSAPSLPPAQAVIVDYVISKLELVVRNGQVTGSRSVSMATENGILRSPSNAAELSWTTVAVDNAVIDVMLVPASIKRRRKTTEQEVQTALRDIAEQTDMLKNCTRAASFHAGLVLSPDRSSGAEDQDPNVVHPAATTTTHQHHQLPGKVKDKTESATVSSAIEGAMKDRVQRALVEEFPDDLSELGNDDM